MDQQTKASSSSSSKGGRRSERGYIYLFGVAASTAGLAVGTLDATGITTRAGSDQDSGEMVATFVFVSSIAAPVGVLLWGFLINRVSVEAAVFAGALGTLLVSSLFLSRRAER